MWHDDAISVSFSFSFSSSVFFLCGFQLLNEPSLLAHFLWTRLNWFSLFHWNCRPTLTKVYSLSANPPFGVTEGQMLIEMVQQHHNLFNWIDRHFELNIEQWHIPTVSVMNVLRRALSWDVRSFMHIQFFSSNNFQRYFKVAFFHFERWES